MRYLVIAVACVLVGNSSADDKKPEPLPPAAKKELERLQGAWSAKEFGRRGMTRDVSGEKLTLEIKDDRWVFAGQEKGVFVALDPKAKPMSFDLKSTEPGRDGDVDLAIYKIAGDTLTVCLHQGKAGKRPTKFETSRDDPDTILMVFERPAKK